MNTSSIIKLLVVTIFIIALMIFVFRPIQINRENSIAFNTIVTRIGKGSEKNIILQLDKGDGTYFINHGLEKGLNIDTLRKKILNEKVTVFYLKSGVLSGFSPVAGTRYITELRIGEEIIYSELPLIVPAN